MKNLLKVFIVLIIPASLMAQKVEYKTGVIQVDGNDIAKVAKIKDQASLGLTSTYELYSLSGKKLVIAVIASEFPESRNDNTSYYYRLSFLTTGQQGIFSLSKFGPEKSFARLIGESWIVVNDKLDSAKVNEMIALKSKNPQVAIEYHLVSRNRMFPVNVRADNIVDQGNVTIGKYRDISRTQEEDTYEFSLPEGLVVAKVTFIGGNNAENFIISTFKDKRTQTYTIPGDGGTYGKIYSAIDRNEFSLKRVAKWLVDRNYL